MSKNATQAVVMVVQVVLIHHQMETHLGDPQVVIGKALKMVSVGPLIGAIMTTNGVPSPEVTAFQTAVGPTGLYGGGGGGSHQWRWTCRYGVMVEWEEMEVHQFQQEQMVLLLLWWRWNRWNRT